MCGLELSLYSLMSYQKCLGSGSRPDASGLPDQNAPAPADSVMPQGAEF